MKGLKGFLRGLPVCLLLAALLSGCRVTEYVPVEVETVKTDTTYVSLLRVDSVYHRDSVFVEHKGDTVWLEKYRYIYKYKVQTDTLWHERTDTISVPYPVEKQLTRWQQFKMDVGGYAVSLLILVICGVVAYVVIKK